MHVLPCAEHLILEQVNYELQILKILEEFMKAMDLVGKQQIDQKRFKETIGKDTHFAALYKFEGEFPRIEMTLNRVSKVLAVDDREPGEKSRCLTERYHVENDAENVLRVFKFETEFDNLKQQRLALRFQSYDFQVRYYNGKKVLKKKVLRKTS